MNHGDAKSTEKNGRGNFSVSVAPLWFLSSGILMYNRAATQDNAPNALLQNDAVKIEEKPKLPSTQSQLAEQLCLVDRLNAKDCACLHYNALADQQRHFIRHGQRRAFIGQWQKAFALERHTSQM